tara:strand:+ start:725 stop:1681 length:957 start_codon:yes stop_codon:yes gene_type:complete
VYIDLNTYQEKVTGMKNYENINEGNEGLLKLYETQPPISVSVINSIDAWNHKCKVKGGHVPFLSIKTVPTSGFASVTLLKGYDVQLDTLSKLETKFVKGLAYYKNIVAISTQYPLLKITETLSIAENLGLRHPSNIVSNKRSRYEQVSVMTTDVLITYTDSRGNTCKEAFSLKYISEDGCYRSTQNKELNTKNKLQIEAIYWEIKEVKWSEITQRHPLINKDFQDNLSQMSVYDDVNYPKTLLKKVRGKILLIYSKHAAFIEFHALIELVAASLKIAECKIRGCFWVLMREHQLPFNMHRKIKPFGLLYKSEEPWLWE